MKKTLTFFSILFLILNLSSCENTAVTPVTAGLSFTANCEYNKNKISVKTQILQNCDTVFSLFLDDNSSLNITYSDDNIKLIYDNLEQNYSQAQFEQSRITDVIYNVFKGCTENTPSVKLENDIFLIEQKDDTYKYRLYVTQTGLPIKLIEENYNIYIEFTDQKIIQ